MNRSCRVRRRRAQFGTSMIESLIALPLLLIFALGAAQIALLFEARALLNLAIYDAARAGSMANASAAVIESALARRLAVLSFATANEQQRQDAERLSAQYLAQGQVQGWTQWRQVSPTAASFVDWASAGRDDNGRPRGTGREISVDNLTHRILHELPASGVAGYVGAEPIGAASGQTLAQATMLKLELRYGAPLSVPVVGPLFGWIARQLHGCDATESKRLGTIVFNRQAASAAADPALQLCRFYRGTDPWGRSVPRWPIQVSASVRLQSVLRPFP